MTKTETETETETFMKNRSSATQAREIAANAPVRKMPLRSPIWEKHKWKVLEAALGGQTEYLFTVSDESLSYFNSWINVKKSRKEIVRN